MKPEDFDEALGWFNRANWDERVEEIQTIRAALRIAKAVCGEPSDEVISVGYDEAVSNGDCARDGDFIPTLNRAVFKAMRDQIIKEAVGCV